jgi:hypothetical protein
MTYEQYENSKFVAKWAFFDRDTNVRKNVSHKFRKRLISRTGSSVLSRAGRVPARLLRWPDDSTDPYSEHPYVAFRLKNRWKKNQFFDRSHKTASASNPPNYSLRTL